jgi:hypothetical protein
MKAVQYLELAEVSSKRSEEFYRAVTQWYTGDRDKKMRRKVSMLARAYRSALNKEINFLESKRSSTEILMALQHARAMKMILEKDLEMLNIH